MIQSRKEENRQLWIARICDLEDSGMTQQAWCLHNGIVYSTLRYWLGKLKTEASAESSSMGWLKLDLSESHEITSTPSSKVQEAHAEVIKICLGEFTVQVPTSCDPQQIFEVLRVVKAVG